VSPPEFKEIFHRKERKGQNEYKAGLIPPFFLPFVIFGDGEQFHSTFDKNRNGDFVVWDFFQRCVAGYG
jgi:hypothetical protein